jgi:hypothetical protein
MSGGWFAALRAIHNSNGELTLSGKHNLSEYEGQKGVRPMTDAVRAELARRPVIMPTRQAKNRKNSKLASTLNKMVIEDTNTLCACIPGWTVFNRWTPARKYVQTKCQCKFNFSVRKDKHSLLFPERRFVRYFNEINHFEKDLIDSTRAMLSSLSRKTDKKLCRLVRDRCRLISRYVYKFNSCEYDRLLSEKSKTPTKCRRTHCFLLNLRRSLLMRVR